MAENIWAIWHCCRDAPSAVGAGLEGAPQRRPRLQRRSRVASRCHHARKGQSCDHPPTHPPTHPPILFSLTSRPAQEPPPSHPVSPAAGHFSKRRWRVKAFDTNCLHCVRSVALCRLYVDSMPAPCRLHIMACVRIEGSISALCRLHIMACVRVEGSLSALHQLHIGSVSAPYHACEDRRLYIGSISWHVRIEGSVGEAIDEVCTYTLGLWGDRH